VYRLKILLILVFIMFIQNVSYAQPNTQSTKLQKPKVAISNPIIRIGGLNNVTVNDNTKPKISDLIDEAESAFTSNKKNFYKKYSNFNSSILVAEMESAIRNTRKFDIVSRRKDVLAIIRKEQQFAKSDLAKGNAAKEGKLENVNYIVIPVVQDFKFYRSTKAIPNISNKYLARDVGLLQINAQIVDTTTGQIKAAFDLKSSFATKPRVSNRKGGKPNTIYFTKMAKDISAQLANQLIDTVFPMVILSVNGNQVWINRGHDGGIKKGEILNVYKPGQELIDPYTHEKLGVAEEYVGKIKVTRVNPKFTIAKIVDVNNEAMMSGFIVRRR